MIAIIILFIPKVVLDIRGALLFLALHINLSVIRPAAFFVLNIKKTCMIINFYSERKRRKRRAFRLFFHSNGIDVCGLYFIVFAAILIYSSASVCTLLNHLIFCMCEVVAAALEN